MAMFIQFGNPMVCTVVNDGPIRPVSFDNSGDEIISSNPIDSMVEPNGPAMIEDVSDDLSVGSLEIKPLSLDDVSHRSDSLPHVEEDMDEVATIDSPDDANVVDINKLDLEDDEIPQLNQSDLDRLKDAMTAPLSPSQNEFLQWHVRLQHLPFPRMKRLAEKGVIPAKFGNINYPMCPWCIFGKQHRKPWRSSKKRVQIRRDDETAPGMCTSTDQLVSAQGGLIPQRTKNWKIDVS